MDTSITDSLSRSFLCLYRNEQITSQNSFKNTKCSNNLSVTILSSSRTEGYYSSTYDIRECEIIYLLFLFMEIVIFDRYSKSMYIYICCLYTVRFILVNHLLYFCFEFIFFSYSVLISSWLYLSPSGKIYYF